MLAQTTIFRVQGRCSDQVYTKQPNYASRWFPLYFVQLTLGTERRRPINVTRKYLPKSAKIQWAASALLCPTLRANMYTCAAFRRRDLAFSTFLELRAMYAIYGILGGKLARQAARSKIECVNFVSRLIGDCEFDEWCMCTSLAESSWRLPFFFFFFAETISSSFSRDNIITRYHLSVLLVRGFATKPLHTQVV